MTIEKQYSEYIHIHKAIVISIIQRSSYQYEGMGDILRYALTYRLFEALFVT